MTRQSEKLLNTMELTDQLAHLSTDLPRAWSGSCIRLCQGLHRGVSPSCWQSANPKGSSLVIALNIIGFGQSESSTFTEPSGVTLVFAGFKSRWTNPRCQVCF